MRISASVPQRDRRAGKCRRGPPGLLRSAGSLCGCTEQTPAPTCPDRSTAAGDLLGKVAESLQMMESFRERSSREVWRWEEERKAGGEFCC